MLADQADVFISVISAQESLGGWLAVINGQKSGTAQVKCYQQFRQSMDALAKFSLIDFDHEAALRFEALRQQPPRIGTMDLKIAAICLTHDAVLLSRNLRDFEQIPGLRVRNWLD